MASTSSTAVKRKREEDRTVRPLEEYFRDDKMVKIYVGPEQKMWIIHEDLICDKVEFFKAAFQSSFQEGSQKTMTLPEDNPGSFGYFVEWLYTSSVQICKEEFPSVEKLDSEGKTLGGKLEHQIQWCRLWVLADRLGIQQLAQLAFSDYKSYQITFFYRHGFPLLISFEFATCVFDTTPETCPFRGYLVAQTVGHTFRNPRCVEYICPPAMAHQTYRKAVMREITEHLSMISADQCCFSHCTLHSDDFLGTNDDEKSLFKTWSRAAYIAGKNGASNPGTLTIGSSDNSEAD